jgi:hypothetical protein
MKKLFILLFLVLTGLGTKAQTSFATADTISEGIIKTGSLPNSTSVHYYKTVLRGNGILRMALNLQNTGTASGGLRYEGFFRNQNSIGYRDAFQAASGTGNDTLLISGIAGDTLYFRVQNIYNNQPFNFGFRYDLLGVEPNNETAANETIATAELLPMNTNRDGHISFSTLSATDIDDYYKIVFPARGTVRIYTKAQVLYTNGSVPSPSVYVLNKAGNAIPFFRATGGAASPQYAGGYYGGPLVTVYDTFSVYARSEDTMYIRINNYHYGLGVGWSASYSLNWTVADTGASNEKEPNNSLAQAQTIKEGDTVNASISLTNTAGTDVDDYYRIIMTKDATITLYVSSTNIQGRAANPSVGLTAYTKGNATLVLANDAGTQGAPLRVRNNGAQPFLTTIIDTMHLFARAKDTFYVQAQNYHFGLGYPWAAHYTLRYQLTDTIASKEIEPNNSIATAQPITLTDTIRGKVNYINSSNVTDADDYFRIVKPARGTIKLYINARNNWGYTVTAWALVVQAYTPTGASLLVKSATGNASYSGMPLRSQVYQPFGTTLTDTMLIECVASDTMFLRLWNNTGANTYEFHYEYLPPAKSDISSARTANEFGFINLATNANSYLWLMGNGLQYTSFNAPLTTYVPGNYDVKLVAIDNICNYRDTAKVNITIAGVEYYTPKRAGTGGDAVIQIFGGALDTATKITLTKGPNVLSPKSKYINTRLNHLTADFDLHFADTGFYDVMIQVPGQSPITYTKGFHIEAFEYPYAWSQVVGPSRIRTNVNNRFTLMVGNRGNVTANGVVVAMVWPKSVQLSWVGATPKPDYSKNDTLVTDTATYIFPNSSYKYIFDSTDYTVAIDTFENKPYDGYIRFLRLAHVPAKGTIELPFIARGALPASARFITYTHHPNILGSCPTGNYEDYGNDIGSEIVDAADMFADKTKIPLFSVFTKTAKIGQKHMQSASTYLGKEFWGWYDGYETDHEANMYDYMAETDVDNEYALQTFTSEVGSAVFSSQVAKAGKLNQRVKAVNELLAKNPNMSAANYEKALDFLNRNGKALGGINYDRLKVLKGIFDGTKNAADLSEKLLKLQELANDCPELKEQIEDLENLLKEEFDHEDVQPTTTSIVTSFDPNAIYGPSGIDIPRFINNFKTQPFLIAFENVDTATADAQDVIIRDTINKAKFDIASVELGDVVIANQLMRVPKGRQQFTLQKKMNNRPGMYVRIVAKTDTAAGVITWMFTTIDSATMNKPPLNGFLKPNISKPEGEGTVSYQINPRSTLADGTLLQSRASIVFDDNEAMRTDVWSNKMDIANPNGLITSGNLRSDTVIRLNLAGTDASSGVRGYTVYYSTNGGTWRALGKTVDDSMIIIGQHDSSYRFYAIAEDNVGNKQTKTPAAEYSVTIPTSVQNALFLTQGMNMSVYPNPATTTAFINVELKVREHADIILQNIAGQRVAEIYSGVIDGKKVISFNTSKYPEGVYSISLRTTSGLKGTAKLIIVR